MTAPRAEKAYEKHAWILLLATAVFSMILALLITFAPLQACFVCNPEATGFISGLGTFFVGTNIFGIAIILKAYRRGQKWAWYTLLFYPIIFAIHGSFIIFELPLAIVSLLGLLLPYRKFFPRKEPPR